MTETQEVKCFVCGAIVPHVNALTQYCDHCESESERIHNQYMMDLANERWEDGEYP